MNIFDIKEEIIFLAQGFYDSDVLKVAIFSLMTLAICRSFSESWGLLAFFKTLPFDFSVKGTLSKLGKSIYQALVMNTFDRSFLS